MKTNNYIYKNLNRAIILSVSLILFSLAIIITYNHFRKIDYVANEYKSTSIKHLSENDSVQEVEFFVEEVDFDSLTKENKYLAFCPTPDNESPCYMFTLREKIDGKWVDYTVSSFAHSNNDSILTELEHGVDFVIYSDRRSDFFSNKMNGLDIKVQKNGSLVYTARLMEVK